MNHFVIGSANNRSNFQFISTPVMRYTDEHKNKRVINRSNDHPELNSGFPSSFSNAIFGRIMVDTTQLSYEARERIISNYQEERFRLEDWAFEEDVLALHHDETPNQLKAIPNNFKFQFAFAGEKC